MESLDPRLDPALSEAAVEVLIGRFYARARVTTCSDRYSGPPSAVEATARQAYEQGFNVTLAIDAMTDTRPEAHDYSIRNVFPRLGETGTTQEIIDLLQTRSA